MLNMQIKKRVRLTLLFIGLLSGLPALFAQNPTLSWHGISHELRYQPDGTDFVITNGKLRFNRALYGTNTAFRVEAGDLPEFALYLPGMGGNLRFGLIGKTGSKWLIDAKNITSRYRPGSMLYTITDPILGNGNLQITVLALGDAEGVILQLSAGEIPENIRLFWAFGGVTGKKFSRDGDLVMLVKPQFEATKLEVDKSKGVITDQAIRDRVIEEVNESFATLGWAVHGCIESPIHGAEGNVEYLVWYRFKA